MSALRGDPATLHAVKALGFRTNGPGYFGKIYNEEEGPELYATCLPTTALHEGLDAFPTIVPTLTRQELAHLVAGGQPTEEITFKARQHAHMRIAIGKSPFADASDHRELPL